MDGALEPQSPPEPLDLKRYMRLLPCPDELPKVTGAAAENAWSNGMQRLHCQVGGRPKQATSGRSCEFRDKYNLELNRTEFDMNRAVVLLADGDAQTPKGWVQSPRRCYRGPGWRFPKLYDILIAQAVKAVHV